NSAHSAVPVWPVRQVTLEAQNRPAIQSQKSSRFRRLRDPTANLLQVPSAPGSILFAGRMCRPARLGPALLCDLPPSPDGERIVRNILGDHGAGAHIGPVPDLDRRHQCRVRTDEGTGTEGRVVLLGAVVVAGNGPRADICPLAHAGIADIGQMIGGGPRFDLRLLDLDEVSDAHALAEPGARAQPGERADRGSAPYSR